jgi:hypothetical protein
MSIIFGKDATDNILPLLLDASGNVIVSASQLTTTGGKIKVDSNGEIIITADTPSHFFPTAGSARLQNLSLTAGSSEQVVATVPAGQLWRVRTYGVYYGGTVVGVVLYPVLNIGGLQITLISISPPPDKGVTLTYPNALLNAGDSISCVIQGATLNDDFIGVVSYDILK